MDIDDRLPPFSIESEQALLGCILLDPKMVMPQLEATIKGCEFFYDLRHQNIYQAACELSNENIPIDMVTLVERLSANGNLEACGGASFVSQLPDASPSAWNFSVYLDTLKTHFVRRQVISIAAEAIGKAYEASDAVELVDDLEKKLSDVSKTLAGETDARIEVIVEDAWNDLEAAYRRGDELTGISTGFPDLDKKTNGLKAGDMFVVAGRPSMGKTSLAMNIAEHVATDLNIPVGVFSLEMTKESLVRRMLCTRARVNERDVRNQRLGDGHFDRLGVAKGQLRKAPLHIDDSSGINIMQLRARARRMVQQHSIKLLVVDYMQLMQAITGKLRDRNRQQEVADISNGLKSLLKELGIPGLILSQLNREMEKDKNRKPRLSDLRESGAIEQDADIIGMLYSPKDETDADEVIPINLLIAKQRNGPTGDVNFTFFKGYTRFESAARVVDVSEDKTQTEFRSYDKD